MKLVIFHYFMFYKCSNKKNISKPTIVQKYTHFKQLVTQTVRYNLEHKV